MKFEKEQIEESMKWLIRFVLRYKKKWAAAGLMLVLGIGSAAGAYFYVPQNFPAALASEEMMTVSPDSGWETEALEKTAKTSAAEAEWSPSQEDLNLAHFFPEGTEQTDMTKSLAGEAFKILMTHDEDWISGIYDFSDVTPAQMAERLGRSPKSVMGRFNPKDSRHDRSNPDTWTINSFKNIRMTAQDGDGNPITPYSNVLEIMSMANQYTYFKGIEDYDLFLAYSKELWKASHSYTVSMSDVYYCSGCMSEDAERKEMEELEAAAKAEALGLAAEPSAENSTTAPEAAAEESSMDVSASTSSTSVIVAGKSTAEKASEAASIEAEALAAAETSETVPESTAGVIVSSRNAKENTSEAETLETTPENIAAASASSVAAGSTDGSSASDTEEAAAAGGGTEGESGATPADAASQTMGTTEESTTAAELTDCPGHVDLIINMKIIGLDEKNNLFENDATGKDETGFAENGWLGWTAESQEAARRLSSQDWFERYGLTVSSISARNPLTNAEIEAYMTQLPSDLSQARKDIIRFALGSVGKVPYYWGGKPSSPNYDSNSFGVLITPDYKGRVYKGLDCSGWINWVYWSVTGKRLPYESTSGLAVTGAKIQRNELQPGDIIVRTGADAHVIMFLGWTSDGRIRCVHESSAAVNNVTVAVRDANWSYYRKLVD